MKATRTFDYLDVIKSGFPHKEDVFAKIVNGEWKKYSIDDYIEVSYNVASALLAKGFRPGDKLLAVIGNCPEWNFLDIGCGLAGVIFVPVYTTLSNSEFLHVFNHSDTRMIVIGTKALHSKLSPIIEQVDHAVELMTIDAIEGVPDFESFLVSGMQKRTEFNPVIEKNKKDIAPDDVATIIYTSGTTGASKGVMLTHRNLTFNANAHASLQTATSKHKMLSFLPLCHSYERTMNYEFQQLGISIYYAESLSTIQRDHKSFHGDGFCAVPRVLEMMYSKLEKAGSELKGFKKSIYNWAWNFAINYHKSSNPFYRLQRSIADKLVYSKWREAFGGHILWIVVGGASIRPNIVRMFTAAKLNVYQGYGMTEASPVIAVNPPAKNTLGTNGEILPGTELKFAEDGEILTRGPHVMKGYFKDDQATREIIDSDGWLHTGDIGYLKDDKHLMITDRKKEIFKLSSGKYIAPQMLENKLRESVYIENCIVFGEHQKFVSAIILPNIDELHNWCRKNNVPTDQAPEELLKNEMVAKMLNRDVEKINTSLADFERLKKFVFIPDTWSVQNEMLSQTLKPKRKTILAKYQSVVESIFPVVAE